jgi:hypothetical protein
MKHLILIAALLTYTCLGFAQKTIKIDEITSEPEAPSTEIENKIENEFEEPTNQKTLIIADNTQNRDEIQTLFKRHKRDGFYVSISSGYSPIDGKDGLVISSRGCWLVDRWFAIGTGGSVFLNNVSSIINYNAEGLTGAYGGLIIEPMAWPLKPVHLSFPVLVGGGVITPVLYDMDSNYTYFEEYFFVVEPGIELEVNFTRWMRIAAFATYRYTSDLTIENVSKNALKNYTAGLTIKVGLF